jgi:hypothetical protein
MSNLIPFNDIERMGMALAKSNLFGVKTPEQAIALMLVAQAEGLHPAIAALEYDIIEGRPALKSQAMLSRFLKAGGKVEWHEHSDTRVAATFSHPSGGSINVDWDMERANNAGLAGRNNWRKFPRQMLRARVISEGVRAVYPVATGGMYVPEEVQDFQPEKNVSVEAYVEPAAEMSLEEALLILDAVQTTQGFKERVQQLAQKIPGRDVEQLKIKAREIYANIRTVEKMQLIEGGNNE